MHISLNYTTKSFIIPHCHVSATPSFFIFPGNTNNSTFRISANSKFSNIPSCFASFFKNRFQFLGFSSSFNFYNFTIFYFKIKGFFYDVYLFDRMWIYYLSCYCTFKRSYNASPSGKLKNSPGFVAKPANVLPCLPPSIAIDRFVPLGVVILTFLLIGKQICQFFGKFFYLNIISCYTTTNHHIFINFP